MRKILIAGAILCVGTSAFAGEEPAIYPQKEARSLLSQAYVCGAVSAEELRMLSELARKFCNQVMHDIRANQDDWTWMLPK